MLDPDTFTSPDSYDIARLAAGAAIQAAENAVTDREPAFALVRPPGHHAEPDRAMGFCLFNNVAVAAAAMLARGLERIAIVDIDVHHGNGTQGIFYEEPRVLYVSTHQFPFYPGTGAADEIGTGQGRGFTVNIPMQAGSTDADYAVVHRDVVRPVLDDFRPQLLLVSAGYDAHKHDPLASMRMTTEGYGAILWHLHELATRYGAMALVAEGGYDLAALAACLDISISAVTNSILPQMITAEAPRASREPLPRPARPTNRSGEGSRLVGRAATRRILATTSQFLDALSLAITSSLLSRLRFLHLRPSPEIVAVSVPVFEICYDRRNGGHRRVSRVPVACGIPAPLLRARASQVARIWIKSLRSAMLIVRCDDSHRQRGTRLFPGTQALLLSSVRVAGHQPDMLGHESCYLAAFNQDRIVGVFPLVHVKSRLFGNIACSLPFVNYGGTGRRGRSTSTTS